MTKTVNLEVKKTTVLEIIYIKHYFKLMPFYLKLFVGE